ncbi:MAG: hypothetical protein AAFO87_08865 [Cyanobacteria bacterium J06607_6]
MLQTTSLEATTIVMENLSAFAIAVMGQFELKPKPDISLPGKG